MLARRPRAAVASRRGRPDTRRFDSHPRDASAARARCIGDAFDEVTVPAGERVVSQGDFAYELFAILEGRAQVEQDGNVVATLGPGELCGEIGLLLTGRRTAAIVAETPTEAARALRPELPEPEPPASGVRRARSKPEPRTLHAVGPGLDSQSRPISSVGSCATSSSIAAGSSASPGADGSSTSPATFPGRRSSTWTRTWRPRRGPAAGTRCPTRHLSPGPPREPGSKRGVFVIAYGNMGGAERLWWLLRHFGHDDCAVLDLDGWLGPLRAGDEEIAAATFEARPRSDDTIERRRVGGPARGARRHRRSPTCPVPWRAESDRPGSGPRAGRGERAVERAAARAARR